MLRRCWLAVWAPLLLCVIAQAQPPATVSVFARASHLQRGINTAIWFAQSRDYSQQRLRTFITEADLRLIAHLGFDHIRLSVAAGPLTDWLENKPQGVMFVSELDRVVHAANSDGLRVIVDLHPEDSYKQELLAGDAPVTRFAALWRALAGHYSSFDPEMVYFEILNEPEQTDTYRWQGIEAAVLAQIRAVAPDFTVIATGAHWSAVGDLLATQPLDDSDVIYTFHDYEPFAFTHQGATWTDPVVAPLRDVPYPSSPANVQPNLAQEPTLSGKYFVSQYGEDRWDAQRISALIGFAGEWSRLHHVPVYCGEFGVHKPFAKPEDRDRWIADTREALEQQHIGWAMWDYQTNFGLVTKAQGRTVVDPGVLKALGLAPQS